MLDDVKVGDTVTIAKRSDKSWGLLAKVTRLTPKQIVANGMRFWKENGKEVRERELFIRRGER